MKELGPIAFVVAVADDEERLDRIVAQGAGVSRREARIWIHNGRVAVAGKVIKVLSRTVRAGREIRVDRGESEVASVQPAVEIITLDRQVIVVNKPPGLLSESDPGRPSIQSLLPAVLAHRGEAPAIWLVHRLDAGTSGVMVVARTRPAARALSAAFRRGTVRKDYLALCAGEVTRKQEVNLAIGRGSGRRWAVRKDGKPAATTIVPLAAGGGYTLVHAQPRTGRTHQIRVHLSHLGHPLVGDGLYGGPRYTETNPPETIGRAMLHAVRLRLTHPTSGAPVSFVAPPPADLLALLAGAGIEAAAARFLTGLR